MIFEYPTVDECVMIHDEIIRISGGRSGSINLGYLESVLDHMHNDIYYPSFLDKLTHLNYSINKNHSFVDGNKRSSIAISELFLQINGYEYVLLFFAKIMEDIAIGVAADIINKNDLFNFLKTIIEGESFSEEQKLMMIESKALSLDLK